MVSEVVDPVPGRVGPRPRFGRLHSPTPSSLPLLIYHLDPCTISSLTNPKPELYVKLPLTVTMVVRDSVPRE